MELIMLIGIPASGKSSFYRTRLSETHVRINGDMLRGNRGLEADLAEACFQHGQPLCVDKMNFTRQHREPYLARAKQLGFLRVGYYFPCDRETALQRNQQNPDRIVKALPDVAIHNVVGKLEQPDFAEGFDKLFVVRLTQTGAQRNHPRDYDYEVVPWGSS